MFVGSVASIFTVSLVLGAAGVATELWFVRLLIRRLWGSRAAVERGPSTVPPADTAMTVSTADSGGPQGTQASDEPVPVAPRPERVRKVGLTRLLITALLGLTLLSTSGAGVAFSALFWGYNALTKRQLVAELTCFAAPDDPTNLELSICEITDGLPGQVLTVALEGDRFYVGGDVVKWQRYLNLAGFLSSYKIHSVGGWWARRDRPARGRNLHGGPDAFINDLARAEGRLPYSLFIREASGFDVSKPPSRHGSDEHFKLHITTEDFSLERHDGPPIWQR